jgi:hypothetical protein
MSESAAPAAQAPKPAEPEKKSFWSTLPGVLTAVGGFIAGVAALLNALHAMGIVTPRPTATPSPTATVQATAVPTVTPVAISQPTASPLLFSDDFGDPNSGWYVETNPESERLYKDGEFHIGVFKANLDSWSWSNHFDDLADFAVEVDARRVEGPLKNDYGILVRFQTASDVDGFYMFGVSSDGHYWVQLSQGDDWSELVAWKPSDAVRQGSAVNHLRVECDGPRMSFLVNSRLVAEVEDSMWTSGDIGLVAGTFDEAGVVVNFDNLRVWRLR